MLKSKFFYLNLIAVVLLGVQYAANNTMIPRSWLPYEGLLVVVLNGIAGILQGQQVTKLKARNIEVGTRNAILTEQAEEYRRQLKKPQ